MLLHRGSNWASVGWCSQQQNWLAFRILHAGCCWSCCLAGELFFFVYP